MQLSGRLSEFSWHDLLELIAHKRLNGWLCVEAKNESGPTQKYQVWFEDGCLVAATQSTRRTNGLFGLMQRQGWLGYNSALKIAQHSPCEMPIGQYFRQQGVLDHQKLQHLFNRQLIPVLSGLSRLTEAEFTFDTAISLPYEQMTGLKLFPYDAQTMARQVATAS